jgi:hypothetical protein
MLSSPKPGITLCQPLKMRICCCIDGEQDYYNTAWHNVIP